MKRRLGIAQALLGDPALLIVDEPTAGLDPEERIRFRNLLGDLAGERTVLLSTHIVEDIASSCRHLAVLGSGHLLYAGDTAGVIGAATGKTWEVRLPVGVAPQGNLTVVSVLHHGDTVSYRVVSGGASPSTASPSNPRWKTATSHSCARPTSQGCSPRVDQQRPVASLKLGSETPR